MLTHGPHPGEHPGKGLQVVPVGVLVVAAGVGIAAGLGRDLHSALRRDSAGNYPPPHLTIPHPEWIAALDHAVNTRRFSWRTQCTAAATSGGSHAYQQSNGDGRVPDACLQPAVAPAAGNMDDRRSARVGQLDEPDRHAEHQATDERRMLLEKTEEGRPGNDDADGLFERSRGTDGRRRRPRRPADRRRRRSRGSDPCRRWRSISPGRSAPTRSASLRQRGADLAAHPDFRGELRRALAETRHFTMPGIQPEA